LAGPWSVEAGTPAAAPPALADEWIPLRDEASGTPNSQEYLSLLARSGRIEALKRGRVWFTTRSALAKYRKLVEQSRSWLSHGRGLLL